MLLLAGSMLLMVLAVFGCALDLGRIFLAQAELRSRIEAAALSAAVEMDGTQAGLEKARLAAGSAEVQFGTAPDGRFEPAPLQALGYQYARVKAASDVPLTLVRVVVPESARTITVEATARHMPADAPVIAELLK